MYNNTQLVSLSQTGNQLSLVVLRCEVRKSISLSVKLPISLANVFPKLLLLRQWEGVSGGRELADKGGLLNECSRRRLSHALKQQYHLHLWQK